MILATFAPAVFADCPPAALATALQHVGEMKSAYVSGDLGAFDTAGTRLVATIPCVDDPVTPQLAVEIHHVLGIRAFVNQDLMGTQRALSAVRELAPEWRPNEKTLEADSPMVMFYELVLPPETIPLAARPPGGWLVDGVPGSDIPGHRQFLLQALGRDDEVLFTGVFASPATLPVFDYDTGQKRRNIRLGGTIASGALVIGAGATELAALGARGRADDTSREPTEKLALLEQSKSLEGVAVGLGVAGAVGGVVTWAIPW